MICVQNQFPRKIGVRQSRCLGDLKIVRVGAWEKAEGQRSSFFVEDDLLSKILVSDIFFLLNILGFCRNSGYKSSLLFEGGGH